MPNSNGFINDNRIEVEHAKWVGEPCMKNCKAEVKITMRARVLDVTPEEIGNAGQQAEVEEEVVNTAEADPELLKAGEKVFRKCKACHQVGRSARNTLGPQLNGINGRAAGIVEGFSYSKAMQNSGIIWDAETLSAFLLKPKEVVKGTRMSFAGLKKEKDRAAIVAYLSTFE